MAYFISINKQQLLCAITAAKKLGLTVAFMVIAVFSLHAGSKPTGLLCDLLTKPELSVITNPNPQFGWIVNSDHNNDLQTAFRILVATSRQLLDENKGDLWDTGKQNSDRSQNIPYQGKALLPHQSYYWKVCTWDNAHQQSPYSDAQQFNTGEFNRKQAWPGESRWVEADINGKKTWTFEDRIPITYYEIQSQKLLQRTNGVWFIDFGKSAFAYAKFMIDWKTGDSTSSKNIKVRIGEKTAKDSIDRKPGGGVIFKEYELNIRPGLHEYSLEIPRFVAKYPNSQVMPAHMPEVIPFRYCELDAADKNVELTSARQFALHTIFDDKASAFSSSSKILNEVYDLCRYSVKANAFNGDYASSQRERMMYEADTYIHQMGHYAVDREFTVARYSLENMIYHATWPTEWVLQTPIMAWADYMQTGNSDVLKTYYDELKPKALVALTTEKGLISTKTGLLTDEVRKSVHYSGDSFRDIVDWPQGSMSAALKGGETDDFDFRDYNTVVNAFHYHALVLMAKIAVVVGHQQDADFYTQQAKIVKEAFNKYFLDSKKGIYVDGIGSSHSALHSNMFALTFGLVPPQYKASVIKFIESRGMACSVYGANYLLEGLFDAGEANYAIHLITDTTDRSWYNMIRVGSTITTEAWDNKYKTNNGWSHAWSTSPVHIIPRKLMGIEPMLPGFEEISIYPRPGSIKKASALLPTIRGEVAASFVNTSNSFSLLITIPGNTRAVVWLPLKGKQGDIYIDGKKLTKYIGARKVFKIEKVGSGQHRFEVKST